MDLKTAIEVLETYKNGTSVYTTNLLKEAIDVVIKEVKRDRDKEREDADYKSYLKLKKEFKNDKK